MVVGMVKGRGSECILYTKRRADERMHMGVSVSVGVSYTIDSRWYTIQLIDKEKPHTPAKACGVVCYSSIFSLMLAYVPASLVYVAGAVCVFRYPFFASQSCASSITRNRSFPSQRLQSESL
jgi:hypothetical protein